MNIFSKLPISKRIKIDLHQLPGWAKYLTALTVVAIVVLLVWWRSDSQPVQNWQENRIALVLGWLYIGLGTVYLINRWRKPR